MAATTTRNEFAERLPPPQQFYRIDVKECERMAGVGVLDDSRVGLRAGSRLILSPWGTLTDGRSHIRLARRSR